MSGTEIWHDNIITGEPVPPPTTTGPEQSQALVAPSSNTTRLGEVGADQAGVSMTVRDIRDPEDRAYLIQMDGAE